MSSSATLVDSRGQRITRLQIQRAMRINIGAGCLGMIWMAMSINMPLAMFMETIGASGFLIGLMMTIRFLAMLVQIPSALISERLESRKPMWATLAIIHRSLWFGVAALAFCWHPGQAWLPMVVIAMVGLSDILGNGGSALWFGWMADLIPSKSAGSFWGRRQSIVTGASLVGMGLAGFILDLFRNPGAPQEVTHGFAVVFSIAALAGVLDVVVHLGVCEPRPTPGDAVGHSRWRRMLESLRNRDFRRLTLSMGCWAFGLNMLATFGLIHFKRDFPVTYTHVAALTIAGALGAITSSHLFGILTDRLGPRVLAAVLMVLCPLTTASWFFVHGGYVTLSLPWGAWTLPQVLVVQTVSTFLGGALFAGIAPCQLRLAGVLSRASGRTMAMAVHWSVVGMFAACGTLLGGLIMDFWGNHRLSWVLPNGTTFTYLHVIAILFSLTVWSVALPLILSIRTPVDAIPFGEALSRMVMTNPVNAFRNIYSLQTFSAFGPAHRRAEAARKLGEGRSEIAIPELAARFEDPSMEVQEEAIRALGGINTPEAVSVLLEKLADPACEFVPQIARALRHSGDSRCIDPLIARLPSDDRETLIECIRTLGQLGDRRAIPPLLKLLTYNRERKVLAVSSEALAALGELSAAYQIIPQMRAMPNRMLKRALAVAVGDLLGRKDTFYPILIADTEQPGSGASQMILDLRKRIARRLPSCPPVETLEQIESAYHDGEVARCAAMLLHLGLHLAQFLHTLPLTLDPDRAMEQLLERDRRAAIAIWYLNVCNEPWTETGPDTRDASDLLLGLHLIVSFVWRSEEAGG
ncbi:MAG TPA: MFS transporter [Chthoniobacteraceae bacterium]|nr:MFS transporter [Chthoniobacteraceae bacterium]